MKQNKKLLVFTALMMIALVGGAYYAGSSLQGKFSSSSSNKDTDKDGLSALQESKYGTDPSDSDSDDDGLSDGDEVMEFHSDALNADSDEDGLNDGAEVSAGTLLKDSDTDNDGMEDGDEVTSGTDPMDPSSV